LRARPWFALCRFALCRFALCRLALCRLAICSLALCLLALCLLARYTPCAAAEPERAHGRGAIYEGAVGSDLSRVAESWRKTGTVIGLGPRLVTRGTRLDLGLPAPAIDASSSSCVTLLVLASPNAVFSLTFGHGDEDVRRDFPLESSVGLLEVARCGARKGALGRASVVSLSPRAVLSLFLVIGEAPAQSSRELLPERNAGAPAPAPELGPRPRLQPAAQRLASKRRARSLERPTALVEEELEADSAGGARRRLALAAGCHTFDVLEAGADTGQTDLDARLLGDDGTNLTLDDSTAPEARLLFCAGESKTVILDARGAEPGARLVGLHASWSLPDGLPAEWGPRVRGRLAEALHLEHFPLPPGRPSAASLGVQGTTRLLVPARPGACYVVVVAALGREPERLGLAARAGGRTSRTRARPGRSSASVSLCATGPLLRAEVQSIGAGADWIVGVWDIEQGAP